jgi:hypothetical protein
MPAPSGRVDLCARPGTSRTAPSTSRLDVLSCGAPMHTHKNPITNTIREISQVQDLAIVKEKHFAAEKTKKEQKQKKRKS